MGIILNLFRLPLIVNNFILFFDNIFLIILSRIREATRNT